MRKLNETKRILTEWKKNVIISEGPYDDFDDYDEDYEGLGYSGDVEYGRYVSNLEDPYGDEIDDEENFDYAEIEDDRDYYSDQGPMLTIEPNDSSIFGVIRKRDGSELTLKISEYADESDYDRDDVYVLELNPHNTLQEIEELISDHGVRLVSDVDKSYDYDSERDDDLYNVDEWLEMSKF